MNPCIMCSFVHKFCFLILDENKFDKNIAPWYCYIQCKNNIQTCLPCILLKYFNDLLPI